MLSYERNSTALEAESKLRSVARSNFSLCRQAFAKLDPRHTNRISVSDLRYTMASEWGLVLTDDGMLDCGTKTVLKIVGFCCHYLYPMRRALI